MDTNHHIWRVWTNALHRWGLQNLVASFLEAAGPLSVIGAQFVYISEPILDGVMPTGHMRALASMLEDDGHRSEFVNQLREVR
jgi:hypothetical protein